MKKIVFLIHEEFERVALLNQILKKWDKKEIPERRQKMLLLKIAFWRNSHNASYNDIKNYLKEDYPELKTLHKITPDEIYLISKNSDLIDLIFSNVLKKNYPFIINSKSKIYDELAFYKIKEGESIGEIGAGSGVFSLLLGLYSNKNILFVNEIDTDLISHISKKIRSYREHLSIDRMNVVLGKEGKTNFKAKTLDKIIIRKSFHHFSKPQAMLKSIKKSLKKNGELYIYEVLPRLNENYESICDELMTETAIKAALSKGGFELEKETILEGVMIMKYKVLCPSP